MKVLLVAHVFAPDHTGAAVYSSDLAAYLAERGHDVTVLTSYPFYPQWRKRSPRPGRFYVDEVWRSVRVRRCNLYVPRRPTTLRRLLHEASFVLSLLAAMPGVGRHDRIIVVSPPATMVFPGWLMKRLWRAPLIAHVQDLPSLAASSLGMTRSRVLARLLSWLEARLYAASELLVTLSDGMAAEIVALGVRAERIRVCPNWIDVREAAAPAPRGAFRGLHPQLAGRFLVAYAGNVGVKQGLDAMIGLAEATRSEPRVQYLLVGDGADVERLRAVADERALDNLHFMPLMTPGDYVSLIEDVDLCFISQRAGAAAAFFPSKLMGIMARSRPVLVAADEDCELARTVRAGEFGRAAAWHDSAALATHVLELAADPVERARLGANARRAVEAYDRAPTLRSLESEILGVRFE